MQHLYRWHLLFVCLYSATPIGVLGSWKAQKPVGLIAWHERAFQDQERVETVFSSSTQSRTPASLSYETLEVDPFHCLKRLRRK